MKLNLRALSRLSLTLPLGVAGVFLLVVLLARTSIIQAKRPIDYASKGQLVPGEGLPEAAGRQDAHIGGGRPTNTNMLAGTTQQPSIEINCP